jgi:hypothetical protein
MNAEDAEDAEEFGSPIRGVICMPPRPPRSIFDLG